MSFLIGAVPPPRIMAENDVVRVQVLFFASAREAAGLSQTEICLSKNSSTPAAVNDQQQQQQQQANTSHLRAVLAERFPELAATVLDEESVTLALNEEYVPPGQVLPLKTGDTVALIPPISGG